MNCGICGNLPSDTRQLLCPECAQQPSLELRIKLINVMSEVASLGGDINAIIEDQYINNKVTVKNTLLDSSYAGKSVNGSTSIAGGRNWPGLVRTRIRLLQKKHDDLIRCVQTTKQQTDELKSQIERLKSSNMRRRDYLAQARKEMFKNYDKINYALSNERTLKLHEVESQFMPQIEKLKARYCRSLALVFVIKKKKRKRDRVGRRTIRGPGSGPQQQEQDFVAEDQSSILGSAGTASTQASSPPNGFSVEHDLLISFSVLPDLSLLPHYSQPTINSSLERVSMFIVLCSYYLGVQLPHSIFLPGKGHAYTRIYNTSKLEKFTLRLTQSVQNSAKYTPNEFEKFCEALALLCLDMRAIALHLKIPQASLLQVVQLNNTLTQVYNKLVPDAILMDPPYIDSAAQASQGGAGSTTEDVTLESVQDYIASHVYLEINGDSAEWNIVDMDNES